MDLLTRRRRSTTIHFIDPFPPLLGESDGKASPGCEEPPRRRASSPRRPRSISAMDGPSSRYPSMSVAPVKNSDISSSYSFGPRQSNKEPAFSAPPMLSSSMDPPRPAKEGCEWVWFPAGYWAEREIVETPSKDLIKPFRWRKRSGKSSSDHSPRTPLSGPLLGMKAEKKSDSTGKRLSPSRTTTSSESGSSSFRFGRPPDVPLPSPYLTEEAHVQSLQWPSIDVARTSSISGGSVFQPRSAISPSPLHLSSTEGDAEVNNGATDTPTARNQTHIDPQTDTSHLKPGTPTPHPVPRPKSKKLLINWRMLREHNRLKPKHQDIAHTRSPLSQDQATSPSEAGTPPAEEAPKSLKNRSAKLFTKNHWRRKVSYSSATSTSSSLPGSLRNRSPFSTPVSEKGELPAVPVSNWDSDYPGGEAMRIQTPNGVEGSVDLFSNTSTPARRPSPLSRQDEQVGQKGRSPLSTAFTPATSSSSSTLRIRSKPDRSKFKTQKDATGNTSGSNSDRSIIRNKKQPNRDEKLAASSNSLRAPRRDNPRKEWWEVPTTIPPTYDAIQRTVTENTMRTFTFDLPEHLPTSPMCPRNKRHMSGGTGVCVYHGRAKRGRTASTIPAESAPDGASRKSTGDASIGDGDREREDGDVDEMTSDVWK